MKILGIELGAWSLKAVEMESRFRQIDVLELHEIRLPLQVSNPAETYRAAFSQLMARLPSHPEKVVTSLPPVQTALRFIPIPLKARKKVEQMYRFELEDTVPLKLDEALIEHHVSKTKEGSLVFAALSPKKHIRAHLAWLKTIGIDPDWLTFDGMGLINLYLSQKGTQDDEVPEGPVALIDMGHVKTNLAILDQDRLEFFRSLNWGGSAVTQSIAASLDVTLEEAEDKKIEALDLAESDDTELTEAAAQAFSTILADLNHSLVSYQNLYKRPVTSAIITGGTSETKGLIPLLERGLNVTVNRFHPFEGMKLKEELRTREEDRYAESLGRALVFARKSPLLFNFRKEDMGKETSLTEVTTLLQDPNILKLFGYLGVLAVLLFIHVFVSGYLATDERRASNEELKKVFQETFSSVPPKQKATLLADPIELKKFIDLKNNELNQKLKMVSRTRLPTLTVIKGISDAFPSTTRVDVNTIELTDRNFTLEGVLYEGELNQVYEQLKKNSSLSNVTMDVNGQRFTFRGQVVGR